jgi:hypothetical protein
MSQVASVESAEVGLAQIRRRMERTKGHTEWEPISLEKKDG